MIILGRNKKGNIMSNNDNEVSESGAPIFTYTDGEKEWQAAHGEECIEEISNHINRFIGEIHLVFHELVSDTVHIDVHHVAPTKDRPFHTLITSGMSDLPMTIPEEADVTKYMELMIHLPENWKISEEDFKDERWYWPIRTLKFLARFPHKFDSWLGWGHTIPNGHPAEPYADNTNLNGVILLPSISVPTDFFQLQINEDKIIEFYCVIPLYEEETNLKLKKGTDVLMDKFDKYSINDLVDVNRKNVAKKKFGFF